MHVPLCEPSLCTAHAAARCLGHIRLCNIPIQSVHGTCRGEMFRPHTLVYTYQPNMQQGVRYIPLGYVRFMLYIPCRGKLFRPKRLNIHTNPTQYMVHVHSAARSLGHVRLPTNPTQYNHGTYRGKMLSLLLIEVERHCRSRTPYRRARASAEMTFASSVGERIKLQ